MPQESDAHSNLMSPCKNLRGLKALVPNNEASYNEEIINDHELAQRKAGEAGTSTTIIHSSSMLSYAIKIPMSVFEFFFFSIQSVKMIFIFNYNMICTFKTYFKNR